MDFKIKNTTNLSTVKSYSNTQFNKINYNNLETYTLDQSDESNDDTVIEPNDIETELLIDALSQSDNDVFEINGAEIASNAAMAVAGFANGVGNFGENIVDAAVTIGTVVATPFTWASDQISGSNATEEMWEASNSFVAEEHVNNAFADFFENNEIGKTINENASEVMQYGNTGYNFALGAGYLTTTIASSFALAPVSGLGIASSGAIISGTAGFGRGESDALNSGANTQEALLAGSLTGTWEAGQWLFGAKIAGKGFTTVGLDWVSGFVDIPVRSGIQTIYNDQTLLETIEQYGGIEGMLANASIASSFATLGEVAIIKHNKVQANSNNQVNIQSNQTTSDFFENTRGTKNSYGIDQGIFKKMESTDEVYQNVKNNLLEIGFSQKEASYIMNTIDSTGVCTYAEFANEIINNYKNVPTEFERIFGYSMYTSSGQLNDAQLLMELYVFANNTKNGGRLFQIEGNTAKIVDYATANQIYYSNGLNGGKNTQLINSFLQSKDSNLTYNIEFLGRRTEWEIGNNFDTVTGEPVLRNFNSETGEKILYDTSSLKEKIEDSLSNNQNVGIDIYQPESYLDHITLYGMDEGVANVSTAQWNEGTGHSVFITGTNDQGVIVSSWGEKYNIHWEDLEFSQFIVSASTIK